MEGLKGEAPKVPREVDLDQHIRDVEQAAADWGVHTDKLEGRFVSALLAAIATSGRANLAALGDIERLLEKARATGEGELRRLNILIKGGDQVLEMARQAALTAAAAGERAEKEFDASVSQIAEDMAVKLLQQSQRWLVLKQTDRNRRDAWRLAAGVAAVALGLFIGGYATAEWRKGKELEAGEATMAAVERCWKRPVMVRDVKGESVEMCRLQDLELKEDQAGQSGG